MVTILIRAKLSDGTTGGFTSLPSAAAYFGVTPHVVQRWINNQEIGIGRAGRRCSEIWWSGAEPFHPEASR
jgi:hypothetical protein